MNSITLDGVQDIDLGFRVLEESESNLLAPTRDRLLEIPGMHGLYDFGADFGPLPFAFKCAFIPNGTNYTKPTPRALEACRSRLARHMTDGNGMPKTVKLQRYWEPDKYYLVRYSGSSPLSRISYNTLGLFTLPLIAYDPFAYQTEDTQQTSTWDTDMSWESDIAWGDDYSFEVKSPQTLVVNNYGLLNVKPVIELTGSFTSLSLTIGEVMFTYAAPMSGSLVLDFGMKTAKHNGVNALGYTNGNFGILPSGVSDVLVAGSDLDILIDFKFRAKYPG